MRVLNDFDGIAEKMDMTKYTRKNPTNYDQIAFDRAVFFLQKKKKENYILH